MGWAIMSLRKLTTEEAQDRLEWLLGPAMVTLANSCTTEHYTFDRGDFLDPMPPEAIELLHEISRVAATVAKHYDEKDVLKEADLVVEIFSTKDQPVNVGPRGVKITHTPTGETVIATAGKSQLENKASALKNLRAAVKDHMQKVEAVRSTRPIHLFSCALVTHGGSCTCGAE